MFVFSQEIPHGHRSLVVGIQELCRGHLGAVSLPCAAAMTLSTLTELIPEAKPACTLSRMASWFSSRPVTAPHRGEEMKTCRRRMEQL